MSFLHPVRIASAGRFQADVSTVNNDVRHFDDSSFRPHPAGWHDETVAAATQAALLPSGQAFVREGYLRVVLPEPT